MKAICLLLVRAYQVFLGPFLGGNCRFYPSCSQYAAEAIERFGARRGSWLALRRLQRCHPFSPGGVDLVPDAPGAEPDPAALCSHSAPGHSHEEEFAR
jgi:uncharacterized protein